MKKSKLRQIGKIFVLFFIVPHSFCWDISQPPPVDDPPVVVPPRQMVMKNIPAGTFVMGSDKYGEAPPHQVTISAFSMQETEVTQEQYETLMGVNPAHFKDYLDKTNMPVEKVTWYDALLYCNALSKKNSLDTVYTFTGIVDTPGNGCTMLNDLYIDYTKKGYRLPTEAEWEYACRAGTTTTYWWGNDESERDNTSWCYGNSHFATQPVATKQKNPFGLYDMTGNVREWCNDWFAYYDSTATPQTDPKGPDKRSNNYGNIGRGGSWYDTYLSSSYRTSEDPPGQAYVVGFRVVLPK